MIEKGWFKTINGEKVVEIKKLSDESGVKYPTLAANLSGKTPMSLSTAIKILSALSLDNTVEVHLLKELVEKQKS